MAISSAIDTLARKQLESGKHCNKEYWESDSEREGERDRAMLSNRHSINNDEKAKEM